MNKKLSTIMLVFAGFLIMGICYLSITTILVVKLVMYGVFGIPAVIFFILGIVANPGNRLKAAGVTLFIGAAVALFTILNVNEMFHNPKYVTMFPAHTQEIFGDMMSGIIISTIVLLAGVVSFLLGLKQNKESVEQREL